MPRLVSRRPLLIALLVLPVLALPASAAAQDAPPSAARAPAAADLSIDKPAHATILGQAKVTGTLAPYVAGETVVVYWYRNGQEVAHHPVDVHEGKKAGSFHDEIGIGDGGKWAVQAYHEANDLQAGAYSKRQEFSVRYPALGRGKHGKVVRLFKRGLRDLGYDAGGGANYDNRTSREVLAYRKVNNLPHNFRAGPGIVRDVLAGKGGYHVKHPGAGNHAEVPLSKQVLVLARGDKPYAIFPVSTGKPSTPTVTGHFQFYLQQPGYNSEGMYYSFYFHGGYAVHGYASVPPTYPASHGCVRTYIADQPRIYDQLRFGEDIFIF